MVTQSELKRSDAESEGCASVLGKVEARRARWPSINIEMGRQQEDAGGKAEWNKMTANDGEMAGVGRKKGAKHKGTRLRRTGGMWRMPFAATYW